MEPGARDTQAPVDVAAADVPPGEGPNRAARPAPSRGARGNPAARRTAAACPPPAAGERGEDGALPVERPPAAATPSAPGEPPADSGGAGHRTDAPALPGRGPDTAAGLTLHATTVVLAGRACLITGAAGSGKSSLALELMALGAALLADDRTLLSRRGPIVVATAPDAIAGLIEARGIGILRATPAPPAPVALAVDLDRVETDRLPPARSIELLGVPVPLCHKVESRHFPAALRQYMLFGRQSP